SYPAGAGAWNSEWIELGDGQTVEGIDVVLAPAGALSGTVLDAAGPVPDIAVNVYTSNASDGDWDFVGSAWTDEDGSYSVSGLPAGQVRVKFVDYQDRYATEYFDDAATLEDATDVTVLAGETTPGIDAQLDKRAQISGTVLDAGAEPVTWVEVVAYQWYE